ncbi:SWIB/MDM2 domain-containing protein [Phenylobacterium sp. J426]|nr:SWIB/MDM2 domain-containing protein [Phenylobacterium sp. J426]MCR5876111.1 SWIB/MDM2 domain-containing protein [Phenylobacterium sp. J426]
MATGKNTNALQKPLTPSSELAAVVGSGQLSRGETVSKIWDYIKKNNLQNPPEQARNPRRRQAEADLRRQGQGVDVRDEQAPGEAPEVGAERPRRARGQPDFRMPRNLAGCSPCEVSSHFGNAH